ncbi:WD repeat and FYVE domain-containing protein 3-like [Oppia nitens]|uniref:WD repeat and FYVE domain-containing protein 3-like n=1 Tax=Oppia nitens TaxID=1686743 RepID=UPI0023DC7476|nr:WD repeat and FYVE domain-containing protein 3-like [Oppia nitens]
MNIMRRLVSQQTRTETDRESSSSSLSSATSAETSLSLSHLNKLFGDIKANEPSVGSSQQVNELHELKIYNILPLFCKVFGTSVQNNGSHVDMFEKFCDVTAFTQMVSRLMVTEIRRRASSKTTENASQAIVEFLEITPALESPSDKKGWCLLSTLNLIVCSNSAPLISIMTTNSLTSTLVKCLYLFFDLPPLNDCQPTSDSQSQEELKPIDRRLLLQKIFSQLLIRLCSFHSALIELTRKDDLSLLFNAITSWCPKHNALWRKTASDVILTMAKNNNISAEYLKEKGCLSLYLENMQRMLELGTTETSDIVEMFGTLISFMSELAANISKNSSAVNIFLDEFKSCFGYNFMIDFCLKLEQNSDELELLKKLINMTMQFTKVGSRELKPRPLSVNHLFIMDDFSMPRPTTKNAIKNLNAYNVFQTVWMRSKTSLLQELILDAMYALNNEDKANYFILDSQNTLSQFAEKLQFKSTDVQVKFFTLLEFVVFELRYVPCKELISISIIIKSKHSIESSTICLKFLLSILKFNVIFADVFREVGLLDIIASQLIYYSQSEDNENEPLLQLIVDNVIHMLVGPNNQNCQLFSECGAAKHSFGFLSNNKCSKELRKKAFQITQQLVLSNAGEEHLANLLALMHRESDITTNLNLKSSILKSLLVVLRENHRVRAIFRKVGGFVYVMSVLVHMEGCLDCKTWNNIEPKKIWNLLRCVFASLTTAMRYEPANARFFAQEICASSLTDSIRLLGCFTSESDIIADGDTADETNYEQLFNSSLNDLPPKHPMTRSECACLLMRLLYDMTLDVSDKCSTMTTMAPKVPTNTQTGSVSGTKRPPHLSLGSLSTDPPLIVHSSVLISMFQLIPSIPDQNLRVYLMEVLRRLLKSERNQQVMCEIGLVTEILMDRYSEALLNESHSLHTTAQYILERLSAQNIQPKELRNFLRLGQPLNCIPIDDLGNGKPKNQRNGGPIALTRIKTIVSMTTPKDGTSNHLLQPPFVEFDMNQEGFSSLFLPSIAPISLSGNSSSATNLLTGAIVGNSDVPITVNGGIGTGERAFPPQSGFSYTTWICVEKFSPTSNDESHNVRLLTLYRAAQSGQEYACFQLQIAARDKALLISTQEIPIFSDCEVGSSGFPHQFDADHHLRVWSPELIQEGQWHHIAIILNRALLKNSTVSVYIDGQLIASQKLHYISSVVGGISGISNASPLFVNGFIGTPPQWRKQSRLVWKQGPCHLLEEPLNSMFVAYIHSLGPNYIGSFQGVTHVQAFQQIQQHIPEDRVIFGLNSRATSAMTLAKMRRVYSRFDCRQISKLLGISTHENATPIYVLHNSSAHLCGPSRSLGGILIGNIGARCFVPKPVTVTCSDIGGATLLLGLIANTQDVESLYASVKALVCVIRTNRELQLEMERINGYQTLAMLFRRKRQFLNSHVLHLTFNLIGTLDIKRSNDSSMEIQRFGAFKDLLADQLDLWAQNELLKSLLEHLNELLLESSHSSSENKSSNLKVLRDMSLLPKLLNLTREIRITDTKILSLLYTLCFRLLNQTSRHSDLLYFGQFIASLLPANSDEKTGDTIELRNSLLKIILQLMTRSQQQAINHAIQEELARLLGFDWFLLFLQSSLHKETVTIGLVNLMVVISNQTLYTKFKEGTSNGGWLKDTEAVLESRFGVQLLGFNVNTPPNSSSMQTVLTSRTTGMKMIRNDLLSIPGFLYMNWLISSHVQQPKVYLVLFQALVGQYQSLSASVLETIETFEQLSLDNLWNCLFTESNKRFAHSPNFYCKDLSITILSMIHTLIWDLDDIDNFTDFPTVLIQFIMYLYHNRKDFQIFCQSNAEFILALCQTIIAEESQQQQQNTNKESSSTDTKDSVLTTHSAKKYIMDFIRLIIINLISSQTHAAVRPIAIFEQFLEGFASCKLAQTELIESLLEHLTSLTEFMSQQHESSNYVPQQQQQITSTNIVAFIAIVVDKLWQDCYLRDRKEILDCILKLMTRINVGNPSPQPQTKSSKTSSVSELTLLYKSLNRTVLYLLSRPLESISDRISMLEVLQRIYTSRQLILISSCNTDSEFFVCLTYCLLQLIDEAKISLSSKSRTTWHVPDSGPGSDADEGALLIASVARKIWDEIYLSKRQLLEESLKINLAPNTPAFGLTSITPEILMLRETLYDPTLKVWVNYIEYEQQRQRRRAAGTSSLDSPSVSSPTAIISEKLANINKFNSLVSKAGGGFVSKIVGGTTGVVSGVVSTAVSVGAAARKEAFRNSFSDSLIQGSPQPWLLMTKNEVFQWTTIHLSIINDFIELQLKQKTQSDYHLMKYVYDDWIVSEYELLIRERAIWGPDYGSRNLDKWKLDMTEGPHRMRKKLIRNDLFYTHYPFKPEFDGMDSKALKFKIPISFDSKEHYKRYRPENNSLIDKNSIDDNFDDVMPLMPTTSSTEQAFQGIKTSSLLPSKSSSDIDDQDISDIIQESQDRECDGAQGDSGFVDISAEMARQKSGDRFEQVEMQTVLRLLEEGERISHMFRVARIQGLDTYEGLLLFGKEHFYLIDGFTLLKTREIRDIDSLPANMHDPIVPSSSPRSSISGGSKRTTKKTCSKFSFEDIKEVHKRRYLLQPIALEVFSLDGRNSLLVFPRKIRNKVYSRFMSVATSVTDNAQDSLMGQKRNANVETAGILSNLIGETSVTQRWVRGEISNFQYLMNLNTLAGRSYNDLMQYPVFPWVIADYVSSELDFMDPRTFRDLSKPMGAQTTDRLEQFKKRFNEWDADSNIKGGDDLIQGPYHYGTFYSSAMIVASYLVRMEPFAQHFLSLQGGHFDLADRMFHSFGDAWLSAAKNNMADLKELIPEFFYLPEFLINSNRFDLGIKQSGVQLDDVVLPPWAKDDTREFIRVHRAALECDYVSAHLHEWIDLIFGYKQQGPAAVEAVNVFHHLFYEGNVDIYTIDDPLRKNATIGFINNFGQIPKQLFKKPHPMKKIFNQTSNLPLTPILPSVGLNSVLMSNSGTEKVFIHHLDNLRPSLHPIKELRGAVGQIIQQDKSLLAVEQNKVLIPPQFNRYIAWGFADHSLRIGPYESDRALFIWESTLLPPNGEILCATVPNPRIIITAGTNSVISIWRIKGKMQNMALIQNLYGHTEPITCLSSSAAYGIIVSGSRDKTCIIWDLNRLIFVRQLGGGTNSVHSAPIAAIAINDLTGDIATCASNWLYLWSINGDLIASVNTLNISMSTQSMSTTQVLCVAFSTYNEWDPQNVIMTGSSDGVVKMWSLDYVQVPIDDDDKSDRSSNTSISSTPTTDVCKGESSLVIPVSKDEIVRRLSIASATAESNKGDEDEESTEGNASSPEDKDNDWDLLHIEPSDDIPTLSMPQSKSTTIFVTSLNKQTQQMEASKHQKPLPKTPTNLTASGASALEVPKIRTSKSDTSLFDSFIIVNENECNRNRNQLNAVLKPGHKWIPKLVFCSKLTMHTAFERNDNTEPAAITALAISKDNKTVFVGDARGRVFSWTVSEGRGTVSDHWVKDELVESCTNCGVKFTFSERRHHCRNCGHVFCSKCSKFESEIMRLKIYKPVRVCQNCFQNLQSQQTQPQSLRPKK